MTAVPGLGVVVYGGSRFCGTEVLTDSTVWSWDGTSWKSLGVFPGQREDALLSYDTRRRVLVLFGGRAPGRVFNDTWEWNGSRWSRKALAGESPGPLEHAAAAFDSARGRVVIFGGGTRDGGMHDRVWEWDGNRWYPHTATGPVARVGHSMAAGSGGVYLYGGFNQAGSLRDLWRWNGTAWEKVHGDGPTHTEGSALAGTGSDLLVAGTGTGDAAPSPPLQVWRFTGGSWTALPGRGPPGRVGQSVAYDKSRRTLVVFGGAAPDGLATNELWEFDLRAWYHR